MNPRARAWLLFFILLGLAASLTSLYFQHQILRDLSPARFCSFSPVLNCETVYRSRFAVVRGMPVALGDVIWFGLALLLALASRKELRPQGDAGASYLFAISIPALSVALFQLYASIVVLKAVSIWGALTYAAVFAIFVISGVSTTTPLVDLPRHLRQELRALITRPFALAVAIMFLAAVISGIALFSRTTGNPTDAILTALSQQPTDFDLWFESQARAPLGAPRADAEVLIVKFTDYHCSACAESHKTETIVLAKYEAAQPGKIEFVVKDFPQDPECNSNVVTNLYDAACEAGVAVRLARERGRGPAMEEWLYSHQAGLTPDVVRQAARDVAGVSDFESEYTRVVTSITNDVELGHRLGVKVVPTIFVNGVRFEGDLRPEFLDQAIAHELRIAASRR